MPLNTNFSFESLKSSQKKVIIEDLENYHNCDLQFLKAFDFYITKADKVYLSKTNVFELSRINSIGLYFGTLQDNERFRLSLEGSQMINAKDNTVKLKNKEVLKKYLSAQNLDKDELINIKWNNKSPYLIVQFEDENLGVVNIKEETVFNYIPKSRKIEEKKLF